jgi:hypothetical protein
MEVCPETFQGGSFHSHDACRTDNMVYIKLLLEMA